MATQSGKRGTFLDQIAMAGFSHGVNPLGVMPRQLT
jgi:hypothetical protein